MKSSCCHRLFARRPPARAFTLIELLFVILVIGILAALLLPAMAKAKVQATLVNCKSNEKQQLIALFIYAHENKDFLPDVTGTDIAGETHQAWDMKIPDANYMAANGAPYKVWYSPGATPPFGFDDWATWWAGNGTFRIVDYAQTFYADANVSSWYFSTNENQKMNAPTISVAGLPTLKIVPYTRPIVACATITTTGLSTNYADKLSYAWVNISHSADPDIPGSKSFVSSHMANPKIPSGGNIGMMDGHVEWRNFKQFIPRNGNGPYFYY